VKRSPLRRTSWMKRGAKPIRPVNVKRARRRASVYSAYLQSPAWKAKKAEVRNRSGGQCECFDDSGKLVRRCVFNATSTHHTRYPKTLGTEPIEWLLDVCQRHHDILEAAHPWRAARRQAIR
jgi:hypothetical protein